MPIVLKLMNAKWKKLYNLIKYLTGTTTSNPLPPSSREEELANDFVDYFMNKIKIH